MMAEYIKRETAVRAVMAAKWVDGSDGAMAMAIVASSPAANVAPVVHGRWIDGKCSNCGVDIPTDDAYDVIFGHECRFCYYCGAKMDGGADHENLHP